MLFEGDSVSFTSLFKSKTQAIVTTIIYRLHYKKRPNYMHRKNTKIKCTKLKKKICIVQKSQNIYLLGRKKIKAFSEVGTGK